MIAFVAFFIFCVFVEIAAISYCLHLQQKFGLLFRLAIFSQIGLPIAVFLFFIFWNLLDPPSHGLEPLSGAAFERSFTFIASVFWAIVFSVFVAAIAGTYRILEHRFLLKNTAEQDAAANP
jgi:hypothetical protein